MENADRQEHEQTRSCRKKRCKFRFYCQAKQRGKYHHRCTSENLRGYELHLGGHYGDGKGVTRRWFRAERGYTRYEYPVGSVSVQYSDINSRMPRHSCCEVRIMQLHDILLLRTSAILPEAISAGGLTPPLIQACFSPPIEVGVISQLIYIVIEMSKTHIEHRGQSDSIKEKCSAD